MPLDNAIFLSSTNKIYGIRGQWVFSFDPTTGALLSSKRWPGTGSDILAWSNIEGHSGSLWASVWFSAAVQQIGATPQSRPIRDIWSIDPATLIATNTGIYQNFFADSNIDFLYGVSLLRTDGTLLWGISWNEGLFNCNPSLALPSAFQRATVFQWPKGGGPIGGDLAWDGSRMWVADQWNQRISVYDNTLTDLADSYTSAFGGHVKPYPGLPTGIAYAPPGAAAYVVDGTPTISWFLAADIGSGFLDNQSVGGPGITLPLGSMPMRIRFNPNDNMLYVPCWNDSATGLNDSIVVINPATNAIVSTKTGFSSPIDCVFSPTANFAVQTSAVGLKVIT